MEISSRMVFSDFRQIEDCEMSSSYMVVALDGKSYKIKTSDIASQIASEFANALGSISFKDSNEYAKTFHDHDIYTSAIWHQCLSTSDCAMLSIHDDTHNTGYVISASSIGSDLTADIEYAKSRISSLQPKLGELRFFSVQSIVSAYTSSGFNGWVPADGKSYYLSDFLLSDDIKTLFKSSSKTFTVPVLSSFLKFTDDLSLSTYEVEPRVCLRKHGAEYHQPLAKSRMPEFTIDTAHILRTQNSSNEISAALKKTGKSYGNGIHRGSGTSSAIENVPISCVNKVDNFTVSGLRTTGASRYTNDMNHTYPSSITLPPYVYVGRSLSSAQLYDFS